MVIINHGLQTLTNEVIIPHSGWESEPNEDSKPRDAEWTTVFKNTSGCLRWGTALHCSPCRFLGFSVKNLSYWLFRILSVPSKIPCKGAFSGFILCLQAWKHLQSRTVHAKSWSQEESWCSLKNLKNQCSLSTFCFSFEKKVVLFSLDSSALWWSQLVRIKLIKIWHYNFSYS